MIVLVLAATLLLLAGCGDEPAPTGTKPIVRTLQEGGLTLVLRHAITDTTVEKHDVLGSCALQRNLTEVGREQARDIGRALRELRVPIGEVRASPMCRTRETARLAFGRVETDRDLVSPGVIGTAAGDERRASRLRALVRRPPPRGENTVLVTHTGNIGGAFETSVEEGEMLVFGRDGRLVGRVRAQEWAELAGAGSSSAR